MMRFLCWCTGVCLAITVLALTSVVRFFAEFLPPEDQFALARETVAGFHGVFVVVLGRDMADRTLEMFPWELRP